MGVVRAFRVFKITEINFYDFNKIYEYLHTHMCGVVGGRCYLWESFEIFFSKTTSNAVIFCGDVLRNSYWFIDALIESKYFYQRNLVPWNLMLERCVKFRLPSYLRNMHKLVVYGSRQGFFRFMVLYSPQASSLVQYMYLYDTDEWLWLQSVVVSEFVPGLIFYKNSMLAAAFPTPVQLILRPWITLVLCALFDISHSSHSTLDSSIPGEFVQYNSFIHPSFSLLSWPSIPCWFWWKVLLLSWRVQPLLHSFLIQHGLETVVSRPNWGEAAVLILLKHSHAYLKFSWFDLSDCRFKTQYFASCNPFGVQNRHIRLWRIWM